MSNIGGLRVGFLDYLRTRTSTSRRLRRVRPEPGAPSNPGDALGLGTWRPVLVTQAGSISGFLGDQIQEVFALSRHWPCRAARLGIA